MSTEPISSGVVGHYFIFLLVVSSCLSVRQCVWVIMCVYFLLGGVELVSPFMKDIKLFPPYVLA